MNKIKEVCRQFVNDRPGDRFMNLHRRLHSGDHRVLVTVGGILVGAILIVAGVLLGLIPGVPGIVLIVLGVALIAAQIPVMAKWCDRWEIILRGFLKKCRAALKREAPPLPKEKSSLVK